MKIRKYSVYQCLIFLFAVFYLTGCSTDQTFSPSEGYINVEGGRIWYKITGEGNQIPIVILHGGPGASSWYLKPLESLGRDRPVVFFDQLGCGRSDYHTDTTLMTIEYHVEQLHQLLQALDIREFCLYGHSWGSLLAFEYYLSYPTGISALIFGSPVFSVKRWTRDADTLIALLPDSVQYTIRYHQCAGTTDSEEYQRATEVYFNHFVIRNRPWSPEVDSTLASLNQFIYQYMWGPDEFSPQGTLLHYEGVEELGSINVPVLFLCGEFDEARPSTVQFYADKVPGSEFFVVPFAAHMTMQDNPDEEVSVISDFLRVKLKR